MISKSNDLLKKGVSRPLSAQELMQLSDWDVLFLLQTEDEDQYLERIHTEALRRMGRKSVDALTVTE